MSRDAVQSAKVFLDRFADPEAVAHYAEGPRRYTPGLDDLHRMTGVLLAERAPETARVLVLGAGGGLELRTLADSQPGWTFVGVAPAAEMLRLAERTLGPLVDRVELIEGYIDNAPAGPFDAATCLLTLHFLSYADRRRTVAAIHRRLRPGAPFVAAHGSFPQGPAERSLWLDRYAAYAIASGAEREQAVALREAIEAGDLMLSPKEDEAILRGGGFLDVTMFYAALTWRGWIGHA